MKSFDPGKTAQPRRMSAVHRLALLFVSLTVFSGFFVVFEPAPYDALMVALMFLLPAIGLTALNRPLIIYLALWSLIIVFGFIACLAANDRRMIRHLQFRTSR